MNYMFKGNDRVFHISSIFCQLRGGVGGGERGCWRNRYLEKELKGEGDRQTGSWG